MKRHNRHSRRSSSPRIGRMRSPVQRRRGNYSRSPINSRNSRLSSSPRHRDVSPGYKSMLVHSDSSFQRSHIPTNSMPRSAIVPSHTQLPPYENTFSIDYEQSRQNVRHSETDSNDVRECRSLYVGNFDSDITAKELAKLFNKYAQVVNVDMKRTREGIPIALIKFTNPDESRKAKESLQGRPFYTQSLKIDYGRPIPSNCIWVGCLCRTTSLATLEREFDRFGSIRKIDYVKGSNHAYILYEGIEDAQAAAHAVRGIPIGSNSNEGCKIDFVDYDVIEALPIESRIATPSQTAPPPLAIPISRENYMEPEINRQSNSENRSRHPVESPRQNRRNASPQERYRSNAETRGRREFHNRRRSFSPGRRSPQGYRQQRGGVRSPRKSSPDRFNKRFKGDRFKFSKDNDYKRKRFSPHRRRSNTPPVRKEIENYNLQNVQDLSSLSKVLPSVWHGNLLLKNSVFSTSLLLVEGSRKVCDSLLTEANSKKPASSLRITQRLRLDPAKLDEVEKRIETSDAFCILLAVQNKEMRSLDGMNLRQLKNLVSYLSGKAAAGVISLPIGAKDNNGVLHAFPPCEFATKRLVRIAPKLNIDDLEDHLLVVIVSGNT